MGVEAVDMATPCRRRDYLSRLGITRDSANPRRLTHAPAGDFDEMSKLREAGAKRCGYLRKLSYSKVWVPASLRAPKHQTVIIFDWDDTLLPTRYLSSLDTAPWLLEQQLESIEAQARWLLETAMRFGHVFIITNAKSGWVEQSATQWIPGLLPLLGQIPIISAQSRYGKRFPSDIGQWKVQAFLDVQRQFDADVLTNLVALGDSEWEMDATRIMGKEFMTALVKTIKFQEGPSAADLVKQLRMVASKFEKILANARSMKVSLEKRKSPAPALGPTTVG